MHLDCTFQDMWPCQSAFSSLRKLYEAADGEYNINAGRSLLQPIHFSLYSATDKNRTTEQKYVVSRREVINAKVAVSKLVCGE